MTRTGLKVNLESERLNREQMPRARENAKERDVRAALAARSLHTSTVYVRVSPGGASVKAVETVKVRCGVFVHVDLITVESKLLVHTSVSATSTVLCRDLKREYSLRPSLFERRRRA